MYSLMLLKDEFCQELLFLIQTAYNDTTLPKNFSMMLVTYTDKEVNWNLMITDL